MIDCAIGVDIGGTKCAAGVVQLDDGKILVRERFPTQPHLGGQAILQSVVECLEPLVDLVRSHGFNLRSIGLGLAELVGPEHQILSCATIDWSGFDVAKIISDRFRVPVSIDADVRAAARAEALWGAGKTADPFLYVTVGTGISACLVVNQLPFLGARGLTGTFASSPLLIPSEVGLIEGITLETFAAGPSLAHRYRAKEPLFTGQAAEVLQRADEGDELAVQVVQTAGRALGAAIAHLVNVLDPQMVVLGGGLGLTTGLYRTSCESALREFVWSNLHRNLPMRSAVLGNDAGWIGAALYSADQHRISPSTVRTDREKQTQPCLFKPVVLESYEAISQLGSDLMIDQVRRKPDSLICLASGGTPARTYELFVEKCRASTVRVDDLRMIKLDEWGGLAMDDPASCERHLRSTIIEPLSLQDRYVAFNSDAASPAAECQRIASFLFENGPIDLCILGLGVNGHLGFNEPHGYLQPHAHVAQLSAASMIHTMLTVAKSRPKYGLTLGMSDLLGSREIILLVSGSTKREPMQKLLSGKIDTQFPASFLSLHNRVHLICDRESIRNE